MSETRAGRKVAEAAYDAGFSDLSHFNRLFRNKYGLTPDGGARAVRIGAIEPARVIPAKARIQRDATRASRLAWLANARPVPRLAAAPRGALDPRFRGDDKSERSAYAGRGRRPP